MWSGPSACGGRGHLEPQHATRDWKRLYLAFAPISAPTPPVGVTAVSWAEDLGPNELWRVTVEAPKLTCQGGAPGSPS